MRRPTPDDAARRAPVLLRDGRAGRLAYWPGRPRADGTRSRGGREHRRHGAGVARVIVRGRHVNVDPADVSLLPSPPATPTKGTTP